LYPDGSGGKSAEIKLMEWTALRKNEHKTVQLMRIRQTESSEFDTVGMLQA